ncbi:hypothetical protein SARC_09832 [Sphaeroforma arctica JP610]|uniref:Uncharacterized protein n=1 Tax=Sphaeroforma arctica JP610 TaxID=667725 RepID=A0A0L0FMJ3_9EUKA|nr:hypothetical protein SARC_09832 [Sphaeroforma arctica JP610]KNC77716.1 hypothetical protein SARC_09832 [Sphaeroforma arctica JP610]|eukprot:XP_014151618.1 hypothetical protein SARC_09832 [Sphaeroforma arctica JP610]
MAELMASSIMGDAQKQIFGEEEKKPKVKKTTIRDDLMKERNLDASMHDEERQARNAAKDKRAVDMRAKYNLAEPESPKKQKKSTESIPPADGDGKEKTKGGKKWWKRK